MRNRQILYAHKPTGRLSTEDFRLEDGAVGDPRPGEVLCRTILLSMDPANRAWMQGRTYRDELRAGDVMAGFTICEVVASEDPSVAVGSLVSCEAGWQEYANLPAEAVTVLPQHTPLTHHMSVLGITGLTAYFGLLRVGEPAAGDTVLVSAAAGATGSVAGQIARIKGCRVVGVTGSDEKNAVVVTELGFDDAVSYRSETFREDLRRACPDGVHVYFDNVGGRTLDLALRLMRTNGRVVCCGAVSMYDTDTAAIEVVRSVPGVIITRRLRMEGFIFSDYAPEFGTALADLAGWVDTGEMKVLEDVIEGLDAAPSALVGLLAGGNLGKRMVRVGPDPSPTGSTDAI